MSKLLEAISLKWKGFTEYLAKTFRRRRSPQATMTSTARAALSALSPQYTGYAGGDEDTIAIVRGTDVNFGFDLEMMMRKGIIEAMVVLVLGKINSRKTTLAKNLLLVRLRTSFGGRQPRAIVDDVIVRNGKPEWQSTAEALSVSPVPMHEPFNPLAAIYGMSRDEHLLTVEDLILAGGYMRLTGERDYASRVCFLKMYNEYPELASMKAFSQTLEKLNADDVLRYVKQIDDEFKERILKEAEKAKLEIPEELLELMNRTSNVNPERIVEAALSVFYDLDKVLEGPLGRMFSGTGTFEKGFQQRLVVLDYTQLLNNPAAVALVKRFVHRFLDSARNRDDKRFMFQTEISDEAYKMLRIGDEAVSASNDIKGIRTGNKAKILLSQGSRDFDVIGNDGTIQQKASENIFADVSVFIIGKQGKKNIEHLARHIDLTEGEKAIIATQGPGQFLVKIGDNPGIPIDTGPMFTDVLASISKSNEALEEATDRSTYKEDTFIVDERIESDAVTT